MNFFPAEFLRSQPVQPLAGFLKESSLDPKTVCVLLLTGNGSKDVKAASNIINIPKHPINSLDELNLNH